MLCSTRRSLGAILSAALTRRCLSAGPQTRVQVRGDGHQASSCRKQLSAKVGTIVEDSQLGLHKWMGAVWMIANDRNGVSSYEVQRALGVTQKTAWFMLHRIRLAMKAGSFEKIDGPVEIDETYVGGFRRRTSTRARNSGPAVVQSARLS